MQILLSYQPGYPYPFVTTILLKNVPQDSQHGTMAPDKQMVRSFFV